MHWEKDGVPFDRGSQHTTTFGDITYGVIGQKSMRLKLKVERSLAGSYVCVAVNELTGEVKRSDPAMLEVEGEVRRGQAHLFAWCHLIEFLCAHVSVYQL